MNDAPVLEYHSGELKDTGLKMMEPEGTYLVWIDCSSYGDLSRMILMQSVITTVIMRITNAVTMVVVETVTSKYGKSKA